mmetsp:Transcript_17425/g.38132  ORF Transcript_17425/g.38132 Transcript_17425/m.38132 type:complete len:406 (-) Transcript_17425:30-1247(-)
MAEDQDASMDQEFTELIGFLQDPKFEVQRFAVEGVLAQTDNADFLGYCQRHPRQVARQLIRLAERAEATAAASGEAKADGAKGAEAERRADLEAATCTAAAGSALQALVNLSAVPAVRDELIGLSVPRRTATALRSGWLEGRAGNARWYAMLLANLTTVKTGQEAICAEEQLLRFLVAAYVAKTRPEQRDDCKDPLLYLGKVLVNICALPEGRRILAKGEGAVGTLTALAVEMPDRDRRPDVMAFLRNVCLDRECHAGVISLELVDRIACFLYPLDKVEAALLEKLPETLRQKLEAEGAALTGDVAVRHAAAGCFTGLCLSAEGRSHLRSTGGAEVMRAWLQEESDDATKEAMEAALTVLGLSEEELERHLQLQAEAVTKDAAERAASLEKDTPASAAPQGAPAE